MVWRFLPGERNRWPKVELRCSFTAVATAATTTIVFVIIRIMMVRIIK